MDISTTSDVVDVVNETRTKGAESRDAVRNWKRAGLGEIDRVSTSTVMPVDAVHLP